MTLKYSSLLYINLISSSVNPNKTFNQFACEINSSFPINLIQWSNPKAFFKQYSDSPLIILSCLSVSIFFNILFFISTGFNDVLNLCENKCLMNISGLWKAFLIK